MWSEKIRGSRGTRVLISFGDGFGSSNSRAKMRERESHQALTTIGSQLSFQPGDVVSMMLSF